MNACTQNPLRPLWKSTSNKRISVGTDERFRIVVLKKVYIKRFVVAVCAELVHIMWTNSSVFSICVCVCVCVCVCACVRARALFWWKLLEDYPKT